MLRVYLLRDDHDVDRGIKTSPKLCLLAKLRENITLSKALLFGGEKGDEAVISQEQTVLDMHVDHMIENVKRRLWSAALPWDIYLCYELDKEVPNLCLELQEMVSDVNSK